MIDCKLGETGERPMSDVSRLSEEVQTFIDSSFHHFDSDLPPKEREETEQIRKAVRATVDDIIASREMLTEGKFAPMEKLLAATPNLIEELLDERFTRDVIRAAPGYVMRTLELSRLEGSRIPSKMTNRYLQEASRTYVFGLPQASVALCRAGIEQALKEKLNIQGAPSFIPMKNLLKKAVDDGVIDGVIGQSIETIAKEGNTVLHEKPADLAKAYDLLVMLRGVLQHLYA
jgi:hypothetical protein